MMRKILSSNRDGLFDKTFDVYIRKKTRQKLIHSGFSIMQRLVDLSYEELEKYFSWIVNKYVREEVKSKVITAYNAASSAHARTGAVRKGSRKPYFHHPLVVAVFSFYVAKAFNFEDLSPEDLLIAAIYHDTLEDTNLFALKHQDLSNIYLRLGVIQKKYNKKLADILFFLTRFPGTSERDYLHSFTWPGIPLEALLIKLVDKAANLTDMYYCNAEFQEKNILEMNKVFLPTMKLYAKSNHVPAGFFEVFDPIFRQLNILYQ